LEEILFKYIFMIKELQDSLHTLIINQQYLIEETSLCILLIIQLISIQNFLI